MAPDISGWKTRYVPAVDIPTPGAGKVHLFFDLADSLPKYKDPGGVVNTFPSVSSVNGQVGVVVIPNATLNPAAVEGLLSIANTRRQFASYDAVADFGFVGDLVTTNGTTFMGVATTTLTDTSAPFTAADVGKRITVPRADVGVGVNIAQLTTTIAAFVGPTEVTLAAPSTNAVVATSCSYGTDNTAAINLMVATINALTYPTADVFFGGVEQNDPLIGTGAYGWPVVAAFNKPIRFRGQGGGHTTDSGEYTKIGGTRLAWWGTSSDGGVAFQAMITVTPTGVQSLKRPLFEDVWLDCRNNDQNQALYGLKLLSCHGFTLDRFFVMDALACGLVTNIATSPTEAKDSTRFSGRDLCFRQLDMNAAFSMTAPIAITSAVVLSTVPQALVVAANTLPTAGYCWIATNLGYPVLVNYTSGGGTLALAGCTVSAEDAVNVPTTVATGNVVQAVPANGSAMCLDGGMTANTCCGVMDMAQVSHGTTWGPAGLELRNSDSIIFRQIMVNGGNATNDGAINRIRKPGVRLNGSNTSTTLAARNNVFEDGDPGAGGVSVMGVLNTGARLLAMASANTWNRLQLGNGAPVPNVEGSAYFEWSPNGGFSTGKHECSIADQVIPAATTALVIGSLLQVPPQGFQIGTVFRWRVYLSKTAAGVAARSHLIKIGVLGTTADATVQTMLLTPTAVVDNGLIEIMFTVRGPLGAACTGVSNLVKSAIGITGLGTVNGITGTATATFNSTTFQQFISLTFITGAAEVLTITQCTTEVINPGKP